MTLEADLPAVQMIRAAIVLVGAIPGWVHANDNEKPTGDCAEGASFIVLVGQEDLYLNRQPKRASTGGSILKSIVASAMTGGTYLIGFYPGSDFGSLVTAPRSLTTGLQPDDIAQSLGREFSTTPEADRFELLAPATRAEDVDAAIWNTACEMVLVVNAQYSLERIREGVQFSLVGQVLEVPARQVAGASTIAALEYRSMPMPFEVPEDPAAQAVGLERFLTVQRPALVAHAREAGVEIAAMVATKLDPRTSAVPTEALGNTRRQLLCDDCEKSDRVLAAKPARLWVQPVDQPLVIRSLPLVGPL